MTAYEENEPADQKRRSICRFANIDEEVWKWFQKVRATKVSVSGPLIQEKARKVATDLGSSDFKASNGWLESWRKRHNVTHGAVSGEGAAVDISIIEDWKE